MHFAFIPYGARQEVERFMRDLESQKFKLKLTKKGEQDKYIWITGVVRVLPFGVVEYVFPKEYKDLVASTLCQGRAPNRYSAKTQYKAFTAILRKALGLTPLKYKVVSERLLWALEYVSIMPLGFRDDEDLIEPKDMGYKGWKHEAL